MVMTSWQPSAFLVRILTLAMLECVAAKGRDRGTDVSVGFEEMISAPVRADRELGVTGKTNVAESLNTGSDIAGIHDRSAAKASRDGCTAPYPNLLRRYKTRPPWRVAGVDYCVGHSTSKPLKDPTTISMAGVSVNAASHVVTVTGDNVTLDGYDFSGDGGWQVSVQAANTTITNSNFVVGSNNITPIVSTEAASNMTVSFCTIDGAGLDPWTWGGLISYRGNSFTVEWSWLRNAGGDMIQQVDGGRNSTIVIEHNLIENGGTFPDAHGDYLQLTSGGPFTVAINYNTTIQDGGSTQGFFAHYAAQGEIGNNTMIGTVSYFVYVDISSLVTTFTVHDNFFDIRGYGFAYPSGKAGVPNDASHKTVFSNNVNMRTGAVLQDSTRRATKPSRSRQ